MPDSTLFGAPGRIRTSDPQIRRLVVRRFRRSSAFPWYLEVLDSLPFSFTLDNLVLLDFAARWRPGGDIKGASQFYVPRAVA
jgi:hypothetical protein